MTHDHTSGRAACAHATATKNCDFQSQSLTLKGPVFPDPNHRSGPVPSTSPDTMTVDRELVGGTGKPSGLGAFREVKERPTQGRVPPT